MSITETFKRRMLYGLMTLTSLPFLFIVERPENFGFSGDTWIDTVRYTSSVLGYIGISLLVWQLILGTRSIAGLYFDNLPATLKLHSRLGKYVVLLIFMHPILILAQYSEKLPYLIIPSLSTEFEEHVTFGRLALLGLIVIWLTSAIARGKIAYRPWKYVHYIAYPVLVASLLHVPEVGHSYSQRWIQFFWLLFVATTGVCFALRARHLVGFGKVSYKITAKKQLSPLVWLYTFAPQEKKLVPLTGQYVYLQRNLISEEHPFTILDYSQKTGEFSVAFKVFGAYTKKLLSMQTGDTMLVDGPYGTFTNEVNFAPRKKAVFIAGGIGITPFVKHILSRPKDASLLFYANQNRHSAVFSDLLKHHLKENFVDSYSRERSEQSKPHYISEDVLNHYLGSNTNANFYICGPSGMMKSVSNSLQKLGVAKQNIHLEDFGF